MEKNNFSTTVVIVGAGPAGLATSACLNRLSIPNIVLEREDCYASLWKKRAYDRLKLHLAKQYCQLPHMPYPPGTPTFVPRTDFVSYLDKYVSEFDVNPKYNKSVERAFYDQESENWRVEVNDICLDVCEVYAARFLVVATGENSEGFVPEIPGLDGFGGMFIHSNKYVTGKQFNGKDVLVVGCGNSGMEIAYDLSNWGANTSIVARSPVHVLTKEMVFLGMNLLNFLPCDLVDSVAVMLSKLKYGDISNYGLQRPTEGPFYLKAKTGRSPTIDVGTMDKIKNGEIKVMPSVTCIKGNKIEFANETINQFDAIIFATGYKSTVRYWLEGDKDLFNESGMPKGNFPNHWKGKRGLYCAGFARRGLLWISIDAQNIAKDIDLVLNQKEI
ncbi:probable indole-3-pyruvate monooxygenase YUCCA11 [Ricinus communis]|uniref:Flavin-containing monooxygenase n=1 Tax=Ricinus communis TaxID=3988 RepID=B9S2N4_RICCO|nr:probable indole-3-pyruvate monooxygenase YUCCA11 [Ricinus communis]EEF42039.1 monooxygenase, putative [Ricinus communis]|eukprot:XP_002520253.1 probable indole-3-pyruvate monooxygenase YUCCA11 [Ricinus communis]